MTLQNRKSTVQNTSIHWTLLHYLDMRLWSATWQPCFLRKSVYSCWISYSSICLPKLPAVLEQMVFCQRTQVVMTWHFSQVCHTLQCALMHVVNLCNMHCMCALAVTTLRRPQIRKIRCPQLLRSESCPLGQPACHQLPRSPAQKMHILCPWLIKVDIDIIWVSGSGRKVRAEDQNFIWILIGFGCCQARQACRTACWAKMNDTQQGQSH